MNYQQWQSLSDVPMGKTVAVNTGGWIFPGRFYYRPNGNLYVVGPFGKVYEWDQISTWSWSQTEPEQEMLMVKPHGIFCAHWWNEIGCLLNIIQEKEIKFFVELGTLDGGLASLMYSETEYSPGFCYLGINFGLQYTDPRVMQKNHAFVDSFVLWDRDLWQQPTVEELQNRVRTAGRAMIYCDGGNKPLEASLYWPMLRPGDLLGVHDYSDDPNAIGPEVFPKDVEKIIMSGKRLGQDALKDTRILLMEKL